MCGVASMSRRCCPTRYRRRLRIVVVDADFPRIDAVVIAKLMEVSTVVIGVAADAEGAQRLDRWGVEHIVSISSADVTQVVERIRELGWQPTTQRNRAVLTPPSPRRGCTSRDWSG